MTRPASNKLLILDDDPGILRLSRRVLERAGHDVTTAESPDEARAFLAAAPGTFDLIILDYELGPGMTGLEFFRSLNVGQVIPPAILATGFRDERRTLEALRAGVRDVVLKSDEFLELLPHTVERVLREVNAERQAVEAEAIRESEQRVRLAVEAGRLGTWEVDPASWHIECSPLVREHFGLAREIPCATGTLLAAIHPDDRDRVRADFGRVAAERTRADVEFRTVHPDGSIRWIVASGRVTEGGARHTPRLIGVTADLTAWKRAEEDLRAAKDAAEAQAIRAEEEAKRAEAANQAKDHFLAVLSHELRTPLTPALATAHEFVADPTLPPNARDAFEMIRRNIELETKLVDDLLDLTRISRGKLTLSLRPTDLHETVRSVVRMCESELHGKAIRLSLDLVATRKHLSADPARLQQVLWNLLKNATKFTPEGGRVTIRTEDGPGDQVRFVVTDSGIGIAPQLLPRVFDAFEQGEPAVTRRFGGLGLGLAISKALVTMHGGTIDVASDGPGHGATFTVELPASSVAPQAAVPLEGRNGHAAHPVKSRGASILLVEDHADTAAVLARLLKMYGHDVRTADSVAAALKAVESHSFDLLVSDIGLPDGSGLDLMRQLRARRPMKGIVLSGFGMEEDVRRSRDAGFAAHLTKPVTPDDLQKEIVRLVEPR